jgi:hypothetical protein
MPDFDELRWEEAMRRGHRRFWTPSTASLTRRARSRPGAARLPVEHHAGQGAGDAVHRLDTGRDKPAELIQAGRLHLAMTS